jgi:probable poly-beta-1,6-N-acetyl-D-glucosamine export protein
VREQTSHRPHIFELDLLRTLTALSVVAVHIVALTSGLNRSELGLQMQNAVVIALHFTRAVFMFVTAFALVYVYYGKPFSLKQFWSKRGISFLLPYIIWSLVYIPYNKPGLPPGTFIKTAIFDILTGNASFQLYFILLSLQFYIVLPLFLLLFKRIAAHPWKVLVIVFIAQVVLYYVDYHYLQQSTLSTTSKFWWNVQAYQDRFLLTYPFYFLLGAYTALYFQQIKSFLLRHGWIVVGGFLAVLAATWLHYIMQIRIYRLSMDDAGDILQPTTVFYSAASIFLLLWLACCWTYFFRGQDGRPRGYRIWRTLADASFGVYLIHPFFMDIVLKQVIPAMPVEWHVAPRVFLGWFLTAGATMLVTVIALHIPLVSRLFGRAHLKLKKNSERLPRTEEVPVAKQVVQEIVESREAATNVHQ